VYNEEGWICYIAVVEEWLKRKLLRNGTKMESVNLNAKNIMTDESKY